MPTVAAGAACSYIAERGGAALGAFAGGAAGTAFFGPAGTAAGGGIGSYLGGSAGSALSAAFCPNADPRAGDFPLSTPITPPPLGQCPVAYNWTLTVLEGFDDVIPDRTRSSSGQSFGPFTLQYESWQEGDSHDFVGYFAASGNDPTRGTSGVTGLKTSTITSFNPTRVDGLPDDCGEGSDGQPIFPTPNIDIPDIINDPAARTPIDVDVDFNGSLINISGDLVLTGPSFTDNGIALNFNFDGLDFQLFGDGTINIGGGNRKPQQPDSDEPDTSLIFIGVFYSIDVVSPQQSLQVVGNSTFFYPRFGAVQFLGQGYSSEFFPVAKDEGYIENPLPEVFTDFTFAPYKSENTATLTRKEQQK